MKIYFLMAAFLPLFCCAQNCALKKEKDQFSQEPKISTGFFKIGSDQLTIDATAKEIDFFFSLTSQKDASCFNDASTVTILYEGDRLKSNFRNTGTMNCEGLFNFTLRNGPSTANPLQNIITKKVKAFRFTNGKTVTDVTLTDEQKTMLSNLAACMATEDKTLIKKP